MSGEKIASRSQLLHLAGMLAQSVPADFPADLAQELIENKRFPQKLRDAVYDAFMAGLRRPWEKLLDSCGMAHVNANFTERHFPLESVAPDEAKLFVDITWFGGPVIGDVALGSIKACGQPCGPRRAMEYVTRHPVDKRYWLAVPSVWNNQIPVFCGEHGGVLDMLPVNRVFPAHCGWLVLKQGRP